MEREPFPSQLHVIVLHGVGVGVGVGPPDAAIASFGAITE
jgi:hypothetical protein